MIKFLDLQSINGQYSDEIKSAVNNVIDSGVYIGGEVVRKFENEFADYNGTNHCVGVGNGLDAIRAILEGYKELGRLSDGDQIGVPSNTFIATALAVSQAGMIPVLIDPDEDTMNLEYTIISEFIGRNPQVKAIIVVNLYGQRPLDEMSISTLLKEKNILYIEDAAQSHGSYSGTNRKAPYADVSAFSFYPGKNLGAMGDGGAVVTNSSDLAIHVRKYCNYGSSVKYYHSVQGINSRLDPIQAAILSVKLKYLDEEINTRRMIAKMYETQIRNNYIRKPLYLSYGSYHLYVIRCEQRDKLQKYLKDNGIETIIHYPIPIDNQLAYIDDFSDMAFPVAKAISDTCLSLPIGGHLKVSDVSKIINAVNSFKG